jgi:hypothetical protein
LTYCDGGGYKLFVQAQNNTQSNTIMKTKILCLMIITAAPSLFAVVNCPPPGSAPYTIQGGEHAGMNASYTCPDGNTCGGITETDKNGGVQGWCSDSSGHETWTGNVSLGF